MPKTQRRFRVEQSLDVRGLSRQEGFLKAKASFDALKEDQVLELFLDEGDPLRTIPYGLRAEGHEILVSEPVQQGVRLLVRKRCLLP
jgi:TusA-related sulfurtransferase